MTPVTLNTPQFSDLLARAVTEPGIVSTAYQLFHNYSIGNQLLARVTERSNAATEERLKSGHAVGGVSIV